jgi:hypothetical protein
MDNYNCKDAFMLYKMIEFYGKEFRAEEYAINLKLEKE